MHRKQRYKGYLITQLTEDNILDAGLQAFKDCLEEYGEVFYLLVSLGE